MKPSKDLQKQYEFFDVTADVGFWAFGRTINEAYQNASLAMFEVMTEIGRAHV